MVPAWLYYSAIMVTVLSQDIPSEKLIYYRRSLIPAIDQTGYQYGVQRYRKRLYGPAPSQLYNNRYHDNVYHGRPYGANLYPWLNRVATSEQMTFIRKRMPHIWPRMQNESESSPSKAQREVRAAFKKCCNCFNIQPWDGGAEPDGLGPYSRTWWYTQATPSGLWYYDYFIQQSWYTFFTNQLPKWCSQLLSGTKQSMLGKRGIIYYASKCNQAWYYTVLDYQADEPSEIPLTNKPVAGGDIDKSGTTPPFYNARVSNHRATYLFNLSEEHIYNTLGIHIADIKEAGFYISLTVVDTPANTVKEFTTSATLGCPQESGEYIFGDVTSYLGQEEVYFIIGGQDWDNCPAKPQCPTAAGERRSSGYSIESFQIYFI